MTERFLIFGHRGSPKRFPENTLASFDETLRAGADGFETDLRLLADQTAVLYHDDDLGTDEVESLTYSDCVDRNRALNRLDELARFLGTTRMILEVKRSRWEDTLLQHIQSWPDVVVASFDHMLIAALHRRGAPWPLGITIHGSIVGVADYAHDIGATWIFPKYPYVDEETVAALHARGMKVVPWTPNRAPLWERLYEIGCDGVITDYPAEAVQWRDGGRGRGFAGVEHSSSDD